MPRPADFPGLELAAAQGRHVLPPESPETIAKMAKQAERLAHALRDTADEGCTLVGEQTSDHAPIESVYGTVCRTCVTWLADDYETGEFGIAIPKPWPCRVARILGAGSQEM